MAAILVVLSGRRTLPLGWIANNPAWSKGNTAQESDSWHEPPPVQSNLRIGKEFSNPLLCRGTFFGAETLARPQMGISNIFRVGKAKVPNLNVEIIVVLGRSNLEILPVEIIAVAPCDGEYEMTTFVHPTYATEKLNSSIFE